MKNLYGRAMRCPLCRRPVTIIEAQDADSQGSVAPHTMPAGRVRRSSVDVSIVHDDEIALSPIAFVNIEAVCPMSGAAVTKEP